MDALRRLLRDTFDHVLYMRVDAPPEGYECDGRLPDDYTGREAPAVPVPGAFLDPFLRTEIIEGYDAAGAVVPRRPMPLETDADGFRSESTTLTLFGPILVGGDESTPLMTC